MAAVITKEGMLLSLLAETVHNPFLLLLAFMSNKPAKLIIIANP